MVAAAAVMLPPLPCGRRRLTTSAPRARARSEVPSLDASSATMTRAPGNASSRASMVAAIRSASSRAATMTTTSLVPSSGKAAILPRRWRRIMPHSAHHRHRLEDRGQAGRRGRRGRHRRHPRVHEDGDAGRGRGRRARSRRSAARRASRSRRATSSSSSSSAADADGAHELAGGKLVLDHPAPAVARLTICNPERAQRARPRDPRRARRDDAGLDAASRSAAWSSPATAGSSPPATTSADSRRRLRRDEAEAPRRPSVPRRDGGGQRASVPGARRDQRPLPRRRARARGSLRPPPLRREAPSSACPRRSSG